MSPARILLFAILGLPFAELLTFGIVAALVGIGPAFLALLATSGAGMAILIGGGRRAVREMRDGLASARITFLKIDDMAVAIAMAGLLLAAPGFLTDLAAGAVLVGAMIGRTRRSTPRPPDDVVDLEPGQWSRMPDDPPGRSGLPPRPADDRHETDRR